MDAIRSMYQSVRACIETPEGLTVTFQILMGVKQGHPRSPNFFVFCNPLEESLLQGNVDAPSIRDQAVLAQV
jgi:hypothetical protein